MNGGDTYFTNQFISFNEMNTEICVFANLYDDLTVGQTKKPSFPTIFTILILLH